MPATIDPPAPDIKEFAIADPLAAIDLAPPPAPEPRPDPTPAPKPDIPPIEEPDDNEPDEPAPIKDFRPNDEPPAPPAEPKDGKGLRAELKRRAAEVAERDARLAALQKELEDERTKPRPEQSEVESLRNELSLTKAEKQKAADEQRRAASKDHPEVLAIKEPFLAKCDDFTNTLAVSKGSRVGKEFDAELSDLVNDRIELGAINSPGFDDRQEALMDKIEKYGPENQSTILNLITEGARTLMNAAAKQKEVSENEMEYTMKDRVTRYGKAAQAFESIAQNYGKVNESDISGDPLKPAHIIHQIVSATEGGKGASTQVKNLIRLAMVPPPPVDPRQEAVMGPEAFRTMIDAGLEQHEKAKAMVTGAMYDALMSVRLLPSLQKEIADLRAQVAARHREAPRVDPVAPAKEAPVTDEPADPRKFTPMEIRTI